MDLTKVTDEIWRMIFGQATTPDAAPMARPGWRIAELFDPDSLEDQSRHPWRSDFKHPIDTPISIGTKRALMQVSWLFHGLSRQYLYENLYFYDTEFIQLSTLQTLLTQRLPSDIAAPGDWVKNLHVAIGEDTLVANEWIESMIYAGHSGVTPLC